MCIIYNPIGSLTYIKTHLKKNNIHDFKSLKDVIAFQKSFNQQRQQLISLHHNIVFQEKETLNIELEALEIEIETEKQNILQRYNFEIDELKLQMNHIKINNANHLLQKVINGIKIWDFRRKIKQKNKHLENKLTLYSSATFIEYQNKKDRFKFIQQHFNEAVQQSAKYTLAELEIKKACIDELNNFIYGALGEQMVVRALDELSDEFYLINDFTAYFSPAIYNRNDDDYIKSVQIDHLLVAPSGIFLIETKNWNEKSLANLNLRSPVKQIKRTSFAVFIILNNESSEYQISLDNHHWGDKKIPIRNLIVMTKSKPTQEFQYVKVLTIDELIRYVTYFKPIFSSEETKRIANKLLIINNQKN